MLEELSKESEEEFFKDLKEIASPNKNKSTANWYIIKIK